MPIDIYCLPSATCPWDDVDRKNSLSGSTAALESWNQAKEWLQICSNDHEKCLPRAEALPNRLLDLNVYASRDIRLLDVSESKVAENVQSFRYACLSHCWGTTGCSLTTTTSNIGQHNKGIPWSKFPATYKDVVTFLHWLGIRYLWIDSLCIIQNDAEDWLKESAMMASIYAGSYITIAATGAENNQAGCFVHRNLTTTRVSCPYGNDESVDLYLRKSISHDLFWQEDDLFDDEPKADPRLPLLSRGWVYQERILSPRILHFTRNELVWECMQSSTCECGTSRHGRESVKTKMSVPLMAGDLTADNISEAWRQTVIGYTSKNLTYEKDRLPALSGLAKRFCQMKTGIDYLAGLWRDSLELDLLWFIAEKADTEAINTRFPSWSWASVNGEVTYYYPDKNQKIAIEILQAGCNRLGPDPTGQVRSGKIILKGVIEPLKSVSSRGIEGKVKIVVTPIEEVPEYVKSYTIAFDDKRSEEIDVTIHWDRWGCTYDGLYLLKVSETNRGVRFLVLMNLDEVPTGRFFRVGMGIWQHSSYKNMSRPFAKSTPQTITLV